MVSLRQIEIKTLIPEQCRDAYSCGNNGENREAREYHAVNQNQR